MLILPAEGTAILQQFRGLFTRRTFLLLQTLLCGALLCVGNHTVCAALRFAGLSQEKVFCKYHRFLSRARWNALKASRILLHLLIHAFCKQASTLVFAIDETIERRRGKAIAAKGIYRDPVRSSHSHFVKCSGLRWMCLTLCMPIAWAQRCWGLPFLTVLAPSERACEKWGKHHKKITDWARQMVLVMCRWLKGCGKKIVIVADSSYSALELLQALRDKVAFITRLRLDAALYDSIKDAERKNPGRPRLKGGRQPTLKQRLEDPSTQWKQLTIAQWYDQQEKKMEVATGTAVWYHVGRQPVALRWVLLRDPEQKGGPAALLSTDTQMSEEEVIACFIRRWSEEVTLREVRSHLGVETNRQWSAAAIARTTPCLMALFSFVALWADMLVNKGVALVVEQASWYKKELPTFADAITAVRIAIYEQSFFYTSTIKQHIPIFILAWIKQLFAACARAS